MFEVNNKLPYRNNIIGVNFEHISHLFLVFLLLSFEQVNVSWDNV